MSLGRPHMETVQQILDFWFGTSEARQSSKMRREWFQATPQFDAEIRTRFFQDYERAKSGAYDDWRTAPHPCLALIILLDQFPRNLFRGSAQAFATDGLALDAARHAVQSGHDRALLPMERMFLYLPFEHCEDLAAQEQSLALFRTPGMDPVALQHAERHYDEIKRFGRFPYRNAALGRASTAEELRYLEDLKKQIAAK